MDGRDFFGEIHGIGPGDTPSLPEKARTEELYGIVPNTLIFPHSAPHIGPFAVDRDTDVLHINIQYLVNYEDRNPYSLFNRIPLLRVLVPDGDTLTDAFIADVRVESSLAPTQKLYIDEINAMHDFDDLERDFMYLPVRGLVHETEDGLPSFSGDERLLTYGKSLLLAVNEHVWMNNLLDEPIKESHPSFDIPFDTDM